MGFKDFNIVVKDQVMYRQVGNSIAVPVLKELIKEIIRRVE
jgi:DNA (cytosine-5)-methyltransferase 1